MIRFIFLILLVLVDLSHPVSAETTASYAIQVDAFKNLQRAEKRTEFLKTKGLDAFWTEERPGGKARRYVVYIGTYASREEARKEAKRLKQEGVLVDYLIRTFDSSDQERPPQERKEPVPEQSEPGLVISEIVFKLETPGKEAVWIQGNRPFIPSAFAIEEDNPRFVIDIEGTGPVKQEWSQIAADGQFIEKIRTFYHRENRTLRVVLDLQPSKSYRISQFFYQAQNLYAVEVEGK